MTGAGGGVLGAEYFGGWYVSVVPGELNGGLEVVVGFCDEEVVGGIDDGEEYFGVVGIVTRGVDGGVEGRSVDGELYFGGALGVTGRGGGVKLGGGVVFFSVEGEEYFGGALGVEGRMLGLLDGGLIDDGGLLLLDGGFEELDPGFLLDCPSTIVVARNSTHSAAANIRVHLCIVIPF